jgi:hypothetical protein
MGTFQMKFVAGQVVMCDWTFTGKYIAPTTTANLTPALPTGIGPRFAGATLTIGGGSVVIPELTITANNTVIYRESGGESGDSTGYLAAHITDRRIVVAIPPEADTTKDWYADWVAGTTAALSLSVGGSGAISVTAPALQPINVQPADRNGLIADALDFLCTTTTDAGDDEIVIDGI